MSLLPDHSALQHERGPQRAPRPLPLFLELVRATAEADPALARRALDGLVSYERADRPPPPAPRAEIARVGAAALRDHGGSGPPAILIPSLINPPNILDLDPQVSLAAAMAKMGRRVLLLDWGRASDRSQLSVGGHVEQLLLPLVNALGEPAALVGYCLGGTMAIAAANLAPVERLVTLAAPWNFAAYPAQGRDSLKAMWRNVKGAADGFGALPMEVLQAAFWSLDPHRTVAKFAKFAELDPGSAEARRFVQLEDWANEGEPLPTAAARELIEDLFAADLPGRGEWRVGGKAISLPPMPTLHVTAAHDRIVPAATAAPGDTLAISAGHVGMIVGGKGPGALHPALARFLTR